MESFKPSSSEEDYFAQENLEARHRLHAEKQAEMEASERAAAKELHWMKCSKCGYDLTTEKLRGVEIEKCYGCGAIVLDKGELEKLQREDGLMGAFFNVFR